MISIIALRKTIENLKGSLLSYQYTVNIHHKDRWNNNFPLSVFPQKSLSLKHQRYIFTPGCYRTGREALKEEPSVTLLSQARIQNREDSVIIPAANQSAQPLLEG